MAKGFFVGFLEEGGATCLKQEHLGGLIISFTWLVAFQ